MKDQSVTAGQPSDDDAASTILNHRKLLSAIADVVCAIDEDGVFQYVSPASVSLFGYAPEEMRGQSFLQFLHPDDVAPTLGRFAQRAPGSTCTIFENRYLKKDGTVVYVLWSCRWDEEDRLLYAVARDGSGIWDVEQRLLKAQQMARVANYEYDAVNDCYTYTSETIFTIFGLDKARHGAYTSELFWSMVHPDDLERVKENTKRNGRSGTTTLEFRIIRPDGQVVHINRMREAVCDEDGNVIKTIGTLQDITERKRSEVALQQRDERFRFLVQNGNDMMGILDHTGTYTFVGANVKQHLGYTAEELVGRNALEFVHPEDVPMLTACLHQISQYQILTTGSFRFRKSCGEWRWVETTVSNHLDNPIIGGLIVNTKDVTERKVKADALLLSEQRFKALVQNSSDLVVIIDEAANFRYISNNITAILGYAPEELVGKNAFAYIHRYDIDKVEEEIASVNRSNFDAHGVQHRFLHKNGSWVWMESKGANHQDNSSIQGILVNSRNISDRVRLQKRLNRELINKQKEITAAAIRAQEAERSQLGLELHDNVNQILTTVKLYNEMYLTGYVKDKELLVKSTQYTQDCINEIRSISKRLSAPTLGKISLEDSIKELVNSINLTRRLEIIYIPQNLQFCNVPEDIHLAVYRIVQEGLNNILKYSEAQVACIEISLQNGRLVLKISDNGKGFDPDQKRSGIGIANMRTRAENMSGTFRLTTAPGKGCQIEIVFLCKECGSRQHCQACRKAEEPVLQADAPGAGPVPFAREVNRP